MKAATNIINGKVWINGNLLNTGVSIVDGKIAAIADEKFLPPAENVIDAKGNLVLPGAIDTHVHSREPGGTDREDFVTITAGAAAGGVTTILDMPNNIPPTSTVENFTKKQEMAESRAIVDFGLYAGAGTDNIDEIIKLAEAGAVGYKTFLTRLAPDRIEEFKGLVVDNDGSFLEVLKEVRKAGILYCIHCENEGINNFYTEKLQSEKRNDFAAFGESRPPISEISGIGRVLVLSKYTNTPVHICHVSEPEAIKMIDNAKKDGQKVSCEVASPYPFFSEEDLDRMGPFGFSFPPLRKMPNKELIYESLLNGKIDIINSDHAPYTKEEVEIGWENIWKVPPSISTIETLFPMLLNEVSKGKMPLKRLMEIFVEKPAQLFGIYPQKGVIQVGSDADIVIVDMNREKTIKDDDMHTKIKTTQFNGFTVKGVPVLTMVRGKVVMEDGCVVGEPGWGTMVKPIRNEQV